jgi:xanthosine utilization system XapX-like protein
MILQILRLMRKKRSTFLLIGAGAGLLEGVLIFLDVPIPYPVLVCVFLIGFICCVIGFVYTIRDVHREIKKNRRTP